MRFWMPKIGERQLSKLIALRRIASRVDAGRRISRPAVEFSSDEQAVPEPRMG
jgi:hypothetical protein